MIMGTFQSWLNDQLVRPGNDPVGWLARQWKAREGDRPRVSSPTAIGRFLEDLAGDDAPLRSSTNEAVRLATQAYIDSKTGQPTADRNEQTGKPLAVVPGAAWVQNPDATQYGSCSCGWARGLAVLDGRQVITCAAGHIFEPEKPGNQAEVQQVQDALNEPQGGPGGQTTFSYEGGGVEASGGAGGSEPGGAGGGGVPLRPGPEFPFPGAQVPDAGTGGGATAPELPAETGDDGLEQVLVMQGMILHTLTRIARHIGLPPEQLDIAVDSAVEMVEMAHGGPQMPVAPFGAPPFPSPQAGAPGDLSSQLYGLAGHSAAPHHPGNDPQAFASWFNAAEYGDPGNG